MNTRIAELLGATVYWNIARSTNIQILDEKLKELDVEWRPGLRTGFSACREALQQIFPGKAYLIDSLKKEYGFVVRSRIVDVETNEYPPLLTVVMTERSTVSTHERRPVQAIWHDAIHGDTDALWIRILQQFDQTINEATANMIGLFLGDCIRHLGGTTLRRNGGVYYLPPDVISDFEAIADAAEAAAGGKTEITIMQFQKTGRAVRAVHESVLHEITEECNQIRKEIETGIGDKAIETRRNRLDELRSKVVDYERTIGESLADVTEIIQSVRLTEGMNRIASVAAAMRPAAEQEFSAQKQTA